MITSLPPDKPNSENFPLGLPNRQRTDHASRQARCLGYICGTGYSHDALNLTASRRIAIQNGQGWPAYGELLAAHPFHRGSFYADLSEFSRIALKFQSHTFVSLEKFASTKGSTKRLEVLAGEIFLCLFYLSKFFQPNILYGLASAIKKWNRHAPETLWTIFSERQFFARVELYLACIGDKPAQTNVARACLMQAVRQKDSATTTRTFASALGWLNYSGKDSMRELLDTKPLYPALVAVEGDLLMMRLRPHLSNKNFYNLLLGSDLFGELRYPGSIFSPR